MTKMTRTLALYNWPENFQFSDHREYLIELINAARIEPFKLAFEIAKDKRQMRTVTKKRNFQTIIRDAPKFVDFEFCRPIDGNFLRLETDIAFTSLDFARELKITHSPEVLSLETALQHISFLCKVLTPQYGISVVMADSDGVFFTGGAGTNTMTTEESRRANSLGHCLRKHGFKNYPFDRLVDIYELNVLNENHLTRQIFGQTLASWIRSKNRGQLVEITPKTAVWLVPENIRSLIRTMLLNEGYLEYDQKGIAG